LTACSVAVGIVRQINKLADTAYLDGLLASVCSFDHELNFGLYGTTAFDQLVRTGCLQRW
jgi:hypothetical protein